MDSSVNPEKKPRGRPIIYNQELADLICELVSSNGCGLAKLTQMYPELPNKDTINVWRHRFPDFSVQYAQAKIRQADLLAEECLDIADDSFADTITNEDGFEICNTEYIARSRLRIDTRKWLASKLLPKQYGKAAEETETKDGKSIVEQLINKLVL